jgi:hypothetical protein
MFSPYNFVSLPAWRIEDLNKIDVNLFITVHSFQEMTEETIAYYMSIVNSKKGKSLFYSDNYNTDFSKYNTGWVEIFNRPYPINRDGSYNEILWKVM